MTDENKETLNEEEQSTMAPFEEIRIPVELGPQECEPEAGEDGIVVDQTEILSDEAAGSVESAPEEEEDSPASDSGEALVGMLDAAHESEDESAAEESPADQVEEAQTGQEPVEGPAEPGEEAPTVESVIEAILFATDEPLPESKLAGIVEATGKQVRESIQSLNARYEAGNNAFRIEQIAGGYQMLTLPIYNSWLKKMLRVRSDSKLSPAAMETLAIIAYKQPIIRADIEAIRGVAVGEVIRSLMYKGLVKIAGRAEILGRPMLYGTTKKFLEVFGLNSIKDLPKAEELKNPDRG
jgi:segregation and condensation protein B